MYREGKGDGERVREEGREGKCEVHFFGHCCVPTSQEHNRYYPGV
jgi:hypothetical protein